MFAGCGIGGFFQAVGCSVDAGIISFECGTKISPRSSWATASAIWSNQQPASLGPAPWLQPTPWARASEILTTPSPPPQKFFPRNKSVNGFAHSLHAAARHFANVQQ